MPEPLILLRGIVLAVLLPGARSAAQTPVGRIERIAQLVSGGQPVQISQASEFVQIRRGLTETWILAGPKMSLAETDRLRVRRYVDARVKVDRPTQRGNLTFLSEVLSSDGGQVFQMAATPVEQSEYVIGDTVGQQELSVVIERGALIVHWSAGRLAVVAAGVRSVITGTKAVFAMDSTGDDGLLYLEEGSVALPDFPEARVSPGQIVRLRRGIPPVISKPSPIEQNGYRQGARFNGDQLWSRFKPFWQKPAFFLPAAAVVGVATAVAATSGGGPKEGTVIARIPF